MANQKRLMRLYEGDMQALGIPLPGNPDKGEKD